MEKAETRGKTLTVKIKYHDFQQITRSRTQKECIQQLDDMKSLINELCYDIEPAEKRIRLLGISMSNLDNEEEVKKSVQLTLNF